MQTWIIRNLHHDPSFLQGAAEARVSHLFLAVVWFGLLLILPLLLSVILLLLLFLRQEVVQPGQVVLGKDHVQHLSYNHQTQDLRGWTQRYTDTQALF